MNRALDMTEGPLFKRIIKFAVPIMLTGLLQVLFNAADLAVVGQFSSSASVGAVGATSSLINLMLSFFMGASLGSGITVAHSLGAKDDEAVSQTVHTSLPLAMLIGAVMTVVGVVFSPLFLEWMGTPEDIIGLSSVYMRIYFAGVSANLLYNYGAAILRAAGDSKRPLYYLLLSGVLNVLLNLVFVILFKMDVAGVALATTLTQILSAVLVMIALMRRDDACRFYWSRMHFYKKRLISILKIGIPAGIQSSLFQVSNVIIQSSVNSFGSAVVSGNAAAVNVEMFVWSIDNGYTQAALNFVGQNLGAKKIDRIGKIMRITVLCSLITGTVLGGLECIFGRQLLSIYIKDAPAAIEAGMIRLKYIMLLYGIEASMECIIGVLRGMDRSFTSMIVSIVGACVFRVAWVYTVFARFQTLEWLLASYPISWTLIVVTDIIIFTVIKRKLMKKTC